MANTRLAGVLRDYRAPGLLTGNGAMSAGQLRTPPGSYGTLFAMTRCMGRGILLLLGVASIGWSLFCLFAGSVLPEWTGLAGPDHGELYVEALSMNVGLLAGLGVFALIGAATPTFALAAALVFAMCAAGAAAGRILGMVQGAETGPYNGVALASEIAIILAAAVAYIRETARVSREAEERKKAERAALEAVLAVECEEPKSERPF